MELPLDLADDDLRPADLELEPFATHRLDEHSQLQFTPAGYFDDLW